MSINRILNEARKRMPTQKELMVLAMIEAGKDGVTNKDLSKISRCYTARLSELYAVGYEVDVTYLGRGLYKYVLIKSPDRQKTPVKQIDVLVDTINDVFNGEVTREELAFLIEELNIDVARKGKTHIA
jgi:hypothetical protein